MTIHDLFGMVLNSTLRGDSLSHWAWLTVLGRSLANFFGQEMFSVRLVPLVSCWLAWHWVGGIIIGGLVFRGRLCGCMAGRLASKTQALSQQAETNDREKLAHSFHIDAMPD